MKRVTSFVVVVVFSACLVLPVAISLGILRLPILGSPSPPLGDSSTEVFVDPAVIVDENLQSGFFWVDLNISSVTDLYTWHVKISWDKNILNGSQILYGDFLSRTISPNGTSSGVANITSLFYDDGYGWAAESVLGDYAGVDDNGTLCAIEFEVVGYGSTDINVSRTGTMPTMLLDSAGASITFDDRAGYFRNKYPGDIDADLDCDYDDFLAFAASYLKVSGQLGYDREADFDFDGDVDYDDFLTFAENYLKSF